VIPMALNYEKLEAAFRRNKRPRGVSVPAVADMRVEALLVGHQLDLWQRAAEAVFREIQVTDSGFMDFAQRDIQSLCARMYNRYSGLTALSERLKANYEKNNESHKRLFLRAMNQAIGTSVADLLSDGQSAAEVQLGVDRSVGLITTLSQEMSARLGKEIMKGISEGRDDFSLRKYILEEASGYPEWRAKLIARDQTGKLFSGLSKVRQQDVGITQYRWRTVGDGAVRPTHAALSNTLQEWSSPPDVGHPGEDIQCRCVADPVLETARLFAA